MKPSGSVAIPGRGTAMFTPLMSSNIPLLSSSIPFARGFLALTHITLRSSGWLMSNPSSVTAMIGPRTDPSGRVKAGLVPRTDSQAL